MPKAIQAPSTPQHRAEELASTYALLVKDHRLDRADIRSGDYLFCAEISQSVALADLDGKLVHVSRIRHFGDRDFVTENVWRASLQPDGTLKLATESTLKDCSAHLIYPGNSKHETLEILSSVTGRSRDVDHFAVPSLAEQLWAEPGSATDGSSTEFLNYLEARCIFREKIDAASKLPEPETGPTEVDRLCDMLFEAASAVIHREPTTAREAVETAIVIRDRYYDQGQDEPHSVISGIVAARLIVAVLAIANNQIKH